MSSGNKPKTEVFAIIMAIIFGRQREKFVNVVLQFETKIYMECNEAVNSKMIGGSNMPVGV